MQLRSILSKGQCAGIICNSDTLVSTICQNTQGEKGNETANNTSWTLHRVFKTQQPKSTQNHTKHCTKLHYDKTYGTLLLYCYGMNTQMNSNVYKWRDRPFTKPSYRTRKLKTYGPIRHGTEIIPVTAYWSSNGDGALGHTCPTKPSRSCYIHDLPPVRSFAPVIFLMQPTWV